MPNTPVPAAATGLPKIPISELVRDPFVQDAFRRAERDDDDGLVAVLVPILPLSGSDQAGIPAARERVERVIEKLIALLDAADGDFLEDEHDGCEPEEDMSDDDIPCDCDPNQPEGGDLGWLEQGWHRGKHEFNLIRFTVGD